MILLVFERVKNMGKVDLVTHYPPGSVLTNQSQEHS